MLSDDFGEKNGAAEGTRTPDPIITNDVLYQLSYSGILLCAGRLPAVPYTTKGRSRAGTPRSVLASRAGRA